jgi:hypothetical protein
MRAAVLAVVATLGCGRIAFDARDDSGAGDAGGDGNDGSTASGSVYVAHSLAGVASSIYSLEPTTGQLTLIGDVPLGHGEMTALAVKDANTLYAMTFTGVFLEITLSPYAVTVQQTGLGAPVGLDTIYRITPVPFSQDPPNLLIDTTGPSTIDADGGDLYPDSGLDYYVWTNSTFGLYRINSTTGMGPLIGTSSMQVYIVGLALLGNNLYGIGRDSNALHPIDTATGEIGPGVTLCLSCPTPFDLEFGDIAAPPPPPKP